MTTLAIARADAIRAALERILAPVDAPWEQSVIDAYVAQAKVEMTAWANYLAQPEPKIFAHRRQQPHYVALKPLSGSVGPYQHTEKQAAHAAGRYFADVERATKDAKREYRQIRDAFLVRVGDTIEYVVQAQRATITGDIRFGQRIEGHIAVATSGDTCFGLKVSVKTNYRYGHNAANGRLTVYAQYPVIYESAEVNGKPVRNTLSEALLANLISGLPIDHKVRASDDQKAERASHSEERHRLDDIRRAYTDLEDAYRSVQYYSELRTLDQKVDDASRVDRMNVLIAEYTEKIKAICAKAGIADPGSKRGVYTERKKIVAQIKALKEKRS